MRRHVISSGYWCLAILLTGWMTAGGIPRAVAAGTAEASPGGANQKETEDGRSDAAARQAAEAFENLYGQDVERVRTTSEPADDVALAKRLLSAARQAPGTPALLTVLCNETYNLAAAHPDGYPTAVEAARFLAAQVPVQAAEGARRVAEVRQKQYAAAAAPRGPGPGRWPSPGRA